MTTWVFLRGLAREARHWGDFPARFRAAFDGELAAGDILTPDLPGNGRRYAEPSPTRVEAMMEACRRELRAQGRPPPYHLLALSLGGMVAVAWALRYPEECRAAVLLSTSMRPYGAIYERLRPGAWPTLLSLLGASGEARERAIFELSSARAAALADVMPAWIEYAREYPVSRLGALRQLLAAARFSAVEKPAVPVLLLAGAGDHMVNPRCSERLAQAWDADFVLHPTAGHDLPLDDGDWVAREVRSWLACKLPQSAT
ncbi:MAG: alpha/beta hydrolase [Pseudomonadota bacterium]|nr:alpha/beta hydrolase [Pseudomonadota bacterium]